MTPVTYTAVFDGLEGENPVVASFTSHARNRDGTVRPLQSAAPINDEQVLAAARKAKPGDRVRVKEITDWEDDELPKWIEEFEVLEAA